MLIALALLVAEDVDNLHAAARARGDGVELLAQEYALGRPAAVEDGELKVLYAVRYGLGHGEEGRDAAAAREGHDGFGVADAVVVEVAQGAGELHGVALFPVFKYPLRGVARLGALYGEHIARAVLAQRGAGAGADGVGLREHRAAYVEPYADVLAGAEEGEALRAARLVRHEGEAPGVPVLVHAGDFCVLRLGVQALGQAVGVIFRDGRAVRGRGDALVAHGDHGEEARKRYFPYRGAVIAVFHPSGPPSCP